MKKFFIILAIMALSTPGYACGKWVLSYSDNNVGGRSGKLVNYCSYQALDGSGQALSVQLPTYKACPILLDPCPSEDSKTEIIINQNSATPSPYGMQKLNLEKLHMEKIGE